MSFDGLLIRDVEGERRIGRDELPIRVGTGSDCQLRLPGPGGGPVLVLDLLDGAPFVQPLGRDTSMRINGEPLTASTMLRVRPPNAPPITVIAMKPPGAAEK